MMRFEYWVTEDWENEIIEDQKNICINTFDSFLFSHFSQNYNDYYQEENSNHSVSSSSSSFPSSSLQDITPSAEDMLLSRKRKKTMNIAPPPPNKRDGQGNKVTPSLPKTVEELVNSNTELEKYIKENLQELYPFESLGPADNESIVHEKVVLFAADDKRSTSSSSADNAVVISEDINEENEVDHIIEESIGLTEDGFDTNTPFNNNEKLENIRTIKSNIAVKCGQLQHGYEYANRPLNFWKNNQHKYPLLSKLALKYLAVCSTSVPSERLFSTAKRIINSSRANLATDTGENMMLLSCWQKEVGLEAYDVFL